MSAEAIGQPETYEERIDDLLAGQMLYESSLNPHTVIKHRWGSRNISDGSRVQLAVSQKTGETAKNYKLLHTYSDPAESDYEIDEQYNLTDGVYLFVKRSVAFNGNVNNGENAYRFERPLTPYDHETAQYLTQEYARSRA